MAAPRTDLDELLAREELQKPGVYILVGTDPDKGSPSCYVGEAEVVRDRLRQHRVKDFWVHAVVFVSKDENLTKAHVRYLEGRLIEQAKAVGRALVMNGQSSVVARQPQRPGGPRRRHALQHPFGTKVRALGKIERLH